MNWTDNLSISISTPIPNDYFGHCQLTKVSKGRLNLQTPFEQVNSRLKRLLL
jgi:hypothetical protein